MIRFFQRRKRIVTIPNKRMYHKIEKGLSQKENLKTNVKTIF